MGNGDFFLLLLGIGLVALLAKVHIWKQPYRSIVFWANIFICGMIAWSLGRDMGAFIYYDKMKPKIGNTIVNSLYDFELGSILRLRGVDIDVVPEEADLKKLVLKADKENKDITQALQEYFARAMGERRGFNAPLLYF